MERGDIVRPTVEAIEATRFSERSRLRVSLKRAAWPDACSACSGVLLVDELYAKGSEQSRALCLECVEPVESEVAA